MAVDASAFTGASFDPSYYTGNEDLEHITYTPAANYTYTPATNHWRLVSGTSQVERYAKVKVTVKGEAPARKGPKLHKPKRRQITW